MINKRKKILLTGATGFVGSHLLNALIRKKYKVVILKRSQSDTRRIDHLLDFTTSYNIDNHPLKEIFKKEQIDVVIHTATNYGRDGQDENNIINTNIAFGVELLENSRKFSISLFINTDTFFNVEGVIASYMMAYTLSKKNFVEWLRYFSKFEIDVVNMKLHHVYGFGDGNDKFIPWLKDSIKKTSGSILLTKGVQLRDFIYIDDVVKAYLFIIDHNTSEIPTPYREYIVSTGVKTSVRDFCIELYGQIDNQFSIQSQLDFGAKETRDDEMMDVDNNSFKLKSIGWNSDNNIEQGIRKMLKKEGLLT